MIGTSIGPYRILEHLGAGGMGEVFLAEDTRLRRQVALKRLTNLSLPGQKIRTSLMREARAAARLNHSGIAAIYDVVEDAECIWMRIPVKLSTDSGDVVHPTGAKRRWWLAM
jgi:serine/threonine protein kinase